MDRAGGLVLAAVAAVVLMAAPASAQEYRERDIREANVMGVQWEGAAGEYRFDVTLYHDDDGEDGYADWWQVEALDGTRLGRRTLAHAHGTEPFTRSAEVTVPEDVETVVVRGHDRTHGYGGTAVLVHLGNGTARLVEQGSEPRSFGDDGGAAVDDAVETEGNGPAAADTTRNASPTDDAGGGSTPSDGERPTDGTEDMPGLGPVAAMTALAGAAVLRRL